MPTNEDEPSITKIKENKEESPFEAARKTILIEESVMSVGKTRMRVPHRRYTSMAYNWDACFPRLQLYTIKDLDEEYIEEKKFLSGSSYEGGWNQLGMTGYGEFKYPHGVIYKGMFDDGEFHGDGNLHYPNGQVMIGVWDKGKLINWEFKFTDGLIFDDSFSYCKSPDRSYLLTLNNGFKPAGRENLTNDVLPRQIPQDCYDAGEGFYNPKNKCTVSAYNKSNILNIPSHTEAKWIVDNCRKAWVENTGYRPDLYELWTTGASGNDSESISTEEDWQDIWS